MKLRIKGNSVRLRVSPSEVARLLKGGRIEDTIRFGPAEEAKLTYALEQAEGPEAIWLRYRPQEVAVVVSSAAAQIWGRSEQVGIYGDFETGSGTVGLVVEKDFACLDRADEENEDTFPNPLSGTKC